MRQIVKHAPQFRKSLENLEREHYVINHYVSYIYSLYFKPPSFFL